MLQLAFINFRKDSYIFVEGKATSDSFYIIHSGKVRCSKENGIGMETNTILGVGDFLGVISCLSGKPQIETVVALTDVIVISVKREQFPDLIKNNTPVAMKIIKTFAARMRQLNETLTKLTLKSSIIDSPEQLFNIAAYYERLGKRDIAIYGYYQYMKACPNGMQIEAAKMRFVTLKPRSRAVYFESPPDLVRSYPKDTMIFSECQSGFDLFIIQEGQVKITKMVDGNEVILAVLKKGDIFGEMALLENKPRSASAIAYDACKLMVVNSQNFNQMVTTQPQLIARLTTTLADRLWAMNRQLENTQIRDPVSKLFDMLALQLEKAKIQVSSGVPHQFDITPEDLANMCGLPLDQQGPVVQSFIRDQRVKLVNNRILISDPVELIKTASYFRKVK